MPTVSTEFSEQQFESGFGPGVENYFWNYARNRIVEGAVRRTVRRGSRILDIGCSVGMTVEHLHKRGYDCHGVELGMATARESVRHVVRTGTNFEDLPLAEREPVETVLLLDVIEHIEKPDEFLSAIKRSMPNLTRIIFAVPARQELWSKFDADAGHFLRYDRATMQALATRNDLRITSMSYFFRGLYPLMLIADRDRVARTITAPKGLAAAFHRLVAWSFMIESVLPLPMPGTSLLAVCEISPPSPERKPKT